MSRPTNETKAERARQVLVDTILKLDDVEPVLGGKWKSRMIEYYVNRLAILLLYQSGFSSPSSLAVDYMVMDIVAMLIPLSMVI